MLPEKHLLVQSQQQKLWKKVGSMFKINYKDTRATSLTSFWSLLLVLNILSHVSNVCVNWLWIGDCFLISKSLECIITVQFQCFISDQCSHHIDPSQLICKAPWTLHLEHYMNITWTVSMVNINWVLIEDILILYKTDCWKSRQSACFEFTVIQVQG